MLDHDSTMLKECGFKKRILQSQATQAELKLKDKRASNLNNMRKKRQEAKEEAKEQANGDEKVRQNKKQMKQ